MMMTRWFPVHRFAMALLTLLLWVGAMPVFAEDTAAIRAFVSIPPQKYFVQRIGGNRVAVSVMVAPGFSPETHEPTPRQLAELIDFQLFFPVGARFERRWRDRLSALNPQLNVVDCTSLDDIAHHHQGIGDAAHSDPHTWTSPREVMRVADCILAALIEADPRNQAFYQQNHAVFKDELICLDKELHTLLAPHKARAFMVYHPSWGALASTYGLKQLAIERHGKPPAAKTLASLIETAKAEGIRTIFVQREFSHHAAQAIANAIGARIVELDPLAEDYLVTMRATGQALSRALSQGYSQGHSQASSQP